MVPRRSAMDDNSFCREQESVSNRRIVLGNDETRITDPPLNRIFFSSPQPERGVKLPILLQGLFGIDYLPRYVDNDKAGLGQSSPTRLENNDAQSIPSDISVEEDDESLQESATVLERKKKRRTVGEAVLRIRLRKQTKKRSSDAATDNNAESNGWIQKQQDKLLQQKEALHSIQQETSEVETRAKTLQANITETQQRVTLLEQELANAVKRLQQDTKLLQQSKKELKRLENKRNKAARIVQETSAAVGASSRKRPPLGPRKSQDDDPILTPILATTSSTTRNDQNDSMHSAPVRRRADSAPTVLRRASSSFIRIHDLDIEQDLSLSEAASSSTKEAATDVFFLDNNVATVLNALARSGYQLATDESDRFVPALSTEKILSDYNAAGSEVHDSSWPIKPWQAPQGRDILVWIGSVDHNGHGCDLPVFKARAIILASPRQVLDLVMDSSRATEYNKMSQGRTDVIVLQSDVHTLQNESDYGIAGEAKIIRSLNKPPLIRRSIEMLSLIYAKPLEDADGYLAVNRSVWEDSSAEPRSTKDTIRSEILLGVNIFRAVPGPTPQEMHCELTTITHAHTSVVPDGIARKMGPTQAVAFLREVQDLFSKQ